MDFTRPPPGFPIVPGQYHTSSMHVAASQPQLAPAIPFTTGFIYALFSLGKCHSSRACRICLSQKKILPSSAPAPTPAQWGLRWL